MLALRSTTSAVAMAAAQGDPSSPVASLQASLHQEVATAFARPDMTRMEAAVTELAAVQQGVAEAIAAHPAKAKKEASVAELARQLAEQLDARNKARIAKDNLELDRVAEARVKGYEGESCRECGNFTLLRNGTCLKCDTCGGTSGCS